MKRIVPCPKCQTKLSIFDLGKPINQKCPKCGEKFVVESEEAKAVSSKKMPTAERLPGAVKTDEQSVDKTNSETASDTKPEITKPEAGADSAPKPAPRPRPIAATVSEHEATVHHSGVTFLHIVVLFGLLSLVVIMQIVAKKNYERRFANLEAQVLEIRRALPSSR